MRTTFSKQSKVPTRRQDPLGVCPKGHRRVGHLCPVATLHIHPDESGNWHFNPKGSRYYAFAVAWTYDPQPLANALTALRFGLVRQGRNIDAFHASPDSQSTRDAVVRTMVAHGNWNFAAIVLEKCKVNPVMREPHRFYPQFAGSLLKFVLRGRVRQGTDRVLFFADTLPLDTRAKREGVLKAIKTTCVVEVPGIEHHVFSHRSESNKWLQVVDYCCWAVYRKYEGNDPRTYEQLRSRLAAKELNVTDRAGQTVYY